MNALERKDWILLPLRIAPLDRIHIMKTLFLIWHKSGRNIEDYFKFEPYLYGPYSLEVYTVLEELQASGLIVQPPRPLPKWVNYFLTEKGKKEADGAAEKASEDILKLIKSIVREVSDLQFFELLGVVYKEAPDFAVNSIFKGMVK